MPNKKINALDVRTAVSTDLMLVGDPANGTAYKSTLANLPLVPYTGATGAVNLGAFGITAASLIKSGGTSAQFLKADGSVDSSSYQAALTLTTTGTSGAATLVGATLNIPQYAAGITGSGVANQLTYWNGTGSVTGSASLNYVDTTGIVTLNKNQNADTSIKIQNSNAGLLSSSSIIFGSDLGVSTAYITKLSSIATPYKNKTANSLTIYNQDNGIGDIAFLNDSVGKITFLTGNAATAQMTLTAAGRLLLGTTSESTYILDVNGTARVSDNLLVSKNQNAVTKLEISNTTGGTASEAQVFLRCQNGAAQFGKTSSSTTPYKILESYDFYVYNGSGGGGHLTFLNDYSGGKIKFGAGGTSTAQMTLTAAGRLLLGTTSESTFILDVVGTARVSGDIRTQNGTTYTDLKANATSGLFLNALIPAIFDLYFYMNRSTVYGGSGVSLSSTNTGTGDISSFHNLNVQDFWSRSVNTRDIIISTIGGTSGDNKFLTYNLVDASNSDGAIRFRVGGWGNSAIMGVTTRTGRNRNDFDFRVGYGATDLNTGTLAYRINGDSGNFIIGSVGTNVASAILNVDSTTKGFLPPRMTTTQINAIATPAEGLQVYNTTINHMCFYMNGAWARISHSPM